MVVPSSYWSMIIEDVPVNSSKINKSMPASSADCMMSPNISSNSSPVIVSKSVSISLQSYSIPKAKCSVVVSSAATFCGSKDAHKRRASRTALVLEKLFLMEYIELW